MLIIRKEQMAVLGQAVLRDFEARMVVHLERFFPQEYRALGMKRKIGNVEDKHKYLCFIWEKYAEKGRKMAHKREN